MARHGLRTIAVFLLTAVFTAAPEIYAGDLVDEDLRLKADNVTTHTTETGSHIIVLDSRASLIIAGYQYSADAAVVWLSPFNTDSDPKQPVNYHVEAFLEGEISSSRPKGSEIFITEDILCAHNAAFLTFTATGKVLVTTDDIKAESPENSDIYLRAKSLTTPAVDDSDRGSIPAEPMQLDEPQQQPQPAEPTQQQQETEQDEPPQNPVNIAPAGAVPPEIEVTRIDDQRRAATIIGRFFLWHQINETDFLELQADSAVVYFYDRELDVGAERTGSTDILAQGRVSGIYLSGDVLLTQGLREITASEIYYDFHSHDAVAVEAQMKTFDTTRGIPIYARAARLRQFAHNTFEADNVVLTSSEFHSPQISATAGRIRIVDETALDDPPTDSSFDAEITDFRLKYYDHTVFYWPSLRSDLERPDLPIKSVHAGHDSTFGATLETRWYLSRLLGLQEPEGTNAELLVDYYSKRGPAAGVNVEYERDDYFGDFTGYMIHDRGEDRLGRTPDRRNLEPPRKLRGRLGFQHRHFLPDDWQLTAGLSYLSDRNFLEQFYRSEFNLETGHETYLHATRKQDNWGLSILGKGRINNFMSELEELPTVEYHLAGESVFDDRLTFYSNTQLSRYRQKFADFADVDIDQSGFNYIWHRSEIDAPLRVGNFNIVPFVAGNFAYEDRAGFSGPETDAPGSDSVWLGELGVRAAPDPFWKVYPEIDSRLWDLQQIRHIIEPEIKAVSYYESDDIIEQRDILSVGISQRLQTQRGPAEQSRTVDWMKLDLSAIFVSDQGDRAFAPDRMTWNRPFVPFRVQAAPDIFNVDLPDEQLWRQERHGPQRHYFAADYIWQISDTTAIISDGYYDTQGGTVQQYNVGLSRQRWPDLSYYIGSRYLRDVQIGDQRGSHALTVGATYDIDPRYSLVVGQQYDFKHGSNVRSDVSLIRRYHRLFYALTFSADQSLDRSAVIFSIWPQGISELAFGRERYMGLGQSNTY